PIALWTAPLIATGLRARRHHLRARPRQPIAPSSPSPTPISGSTPGSGISGVPAPSLGDLISMIRVGLSGLPITTLFVSAGELSLLGSEKKLVIVFRPLTIATVNVSASLASPVAL